MEVGPIEFERMGIRGSGGTNGGGLNAWLVPLPFAPPLEHWIQWPINDCKLALPTECRSSAVVGNILAAGGL